MVRWPQPAGPARGDIWLAALDPMVRAEIQKTRPCVVISPPEMHDHLRTVLAAPMTTGNRPAPFRVPVRFAEKEGLILLDQIHALDKQRLVKHLGMIDTRTLRATLDRLQDIFAE
jgi:mRNA interferase MazF